MELVTDNTPQFAENYYLLKAAVLIKWSELGEEEFVKRYNEHLQNYGGEIDPYKVLTEEEIRATVGS